MASETPPPGSEETPPEKDEAFEKFSSFFEKSMDSWIEKNKPSPNRTDSEKPKGPLSWLFDS